MLVVQTHSESTKRGLGGYAAAAHAHDWCSIDLHISSIRCLSQFSNLHAIFNDLQIAKPDVLYEQEWTDFHRGSDNPGCRERIFLEA